MASSFRVLLVDDEPDMLAIGRLLLERAGPFTVETCASAGEAVERLAGGEFDAVVSDYQMPGMDGLGLLGIVRQRHGHLPFVLFTGRGREEVVIRAINEGADFYVQKGGDPAAQFAELAHQTRAAIERRAAERALEERERRFRALIQNSSDIIRIIDRDGLIAYDSDSGPRILGYGPGSVLGRSPLDFVHPDDRGVVAAALDEVFAETNPGTPTAFRVRHADGSWVAVESVAANLLGTPGVDGIVTTTWPVEARRRAEEALLLSERRLRRAEEIARIGHWELDLETGAFHASGGAQTLVGLWGERSFAEARELAVPGDVGAVDRVLLKVVHERAPCEIEFGIRRADDGRRRELHLAAEYDPVRRSVFGIVHDVTERRRAEEAARAGEERYRTLAEDMPVYFCSFLPDGTLEHVNPALAAMAGHPADALVGRRFFDLLPTDVADTVRSRIESLAPEQPAETHEQIDRRPGEAPRWQQWTNRGFFDTEGRLVRVQAVGLDITELRQTEEALRRANRTLALLSGITRHDLDNQLSVLRGYLSLARADAGPEVEAFLEGCIGAADRIGSLARFAATWEGMGARPPEWLEVSAMVADGAREAGAFRVVDALPPGLLVWAEPLCARVVSGLIENAVRHGRTATMVRFSATVTEDGGLVIACEDDGAGVPAGEKERIFERGYGENTGLGLYLAREALGLTGITIAETGAPGHGARFELVVPPGGWRQTGS
jgi:PAS domain S-box-containing protein